MEEKVDKGFCLIYNNLSNRRKFIRNLWSVLFCIIIILYFKISNPIFVVPIDIIILGIFIFVILYTIRSYKTWRKEPF